MKPKWLTIIIIKVKECSIGNYLPVDRVEPLVANPFVGKLRVREKKMKKKKYDLLFLGLVVKLAEFHTDSLTCSNTDPSEITIRM